MKILLCEDDLNIAVIAKISLEQIGKHEVTHAKDGEEALRLATTDSFDVVLLDEMMPKMSGVEVCRILAQKQGFKTPVVFMSANPQEKHVNEFSNVAKGFIAKPFDPLSLNERLLAILKAQEKAAS